MILYGDLNSGNCLKVKYLADHLGLKLTVKETGFRNGGTSAPEFLQKNPWGQVPVIELDDGRVLSQSNAILRYLAAGSALLPNDPFAAAKVDEWLFWEQYSHEPYVAVCRFHMLYLGKPASEREAWRVERAEKALAFMDSQLSAKDWLTGSTLSIADISLVAYTQFAHEGGFDLSNRPHLTAWVRRVQNALGLPATLH
jgi:glutathione S-transferase